MPSCDADLMARQGSDLHVCYRSGRSAIGQVGDLPPGGAIQSGFGIDRNSNSLAKYCEI